MQNADPREVAQFDRLASRWWDPAGEMAPLHVINAPRTAYIERAAGGLAGKRAVDVGCGGGLLSEALARRGARVLGVDLAGEALAVARDHAAAGGFAIEYRAIDAESLAREQPAAFDLVCCLEMLEHVPDPASVVTACAALAKPGGHVVFSTLNRTAKSWALAIVAAEYALGLVPRGTHEYARFIRPSELERWARAAGLQTRDVTGLRYNPLMKHARLADDADVNYLMHCAKP
ncbi:MAG TPA: bifunctional 2-polyprenyl-6-hydroxyphenol methylase/3-demethylubiquinol 3-O-methyltransferase UbiG [Candidatus Binatia bacterium]|nr:bifunctional 2-polyprenyl-6-hydroxyphenol methylase/3-demethylubiquinol 3-O-methyltransferase UbiG [Candidatus Binatia bacterium]